MNWFFSFHLSFSPSVCITQDSSEVKDLWQPRGHPGSLPGDGHLRQGGHGPAALLRHHDDQNYLHQL